MPEPDVDHYQNILNGKKLLGDAKFAEIMGLGPTTPCRWCGKPIAFWAWPDDYMHLDAEGIPIPFGRGCRSASTDDSNPYDGHSQDLSLKKHWLAEPEKR